MSPIVSIIIPTYNYAHFLSDCIKSVVAQSYTSIEIIVVDDGSTDNTKDIVKKYSSETIKYIYQKNKGLSAARNTGIKNVRGEFVLFLDADDLIPKNYIEKQVDNLISNPEADISLAKNKLFYKIDNAGRPIVTGTWHTYTKQLATHCFFFNLGPPHAYFYRRNVIKNVGYFDTTLKACEDYDYVMRCFEKGFRVISCFGTKVFYRQHTGSMSANKKNQFNHDAILHMRINKSFFDVEHPLIKNNPDVLLASMAGTAATQARIFKNGNIPSKKLEKIILANIENFKILLNNGHPTMFLYVFIIRRIFLSLIKTKMHHTLTTKKEYNKFLQILNKDIIFPLVIIKNFLSTKEDWLTKAKFLNEIWLIFRF